MALDPGGSLVHHGTTSILRGIRSPDDLSRTIEDSAAPGFEHVAGHFGIDLKGSAIMTGLQHFFKWQYPNFMFKNREAFLEEHFSTHAEGTYWSPALLMSMCALGLLMSEHRSDKTHGLQCFHAAESIALVTGLAKSSIVAVQTFLCLAFYSIGSGNLSKGWAFSGEKSNHERDNRCSDLCRCCFPDGAGSWLPKRPCKMVL